MNELIAHKRHRERMGAGRRGPIPQAPARRRLQRRTRADDDAMEVDTPDQADDEEPESEQPCVADVAMVPREIEEATAAAAASAASGSGAASSADVSGQQTASGNAVSTDTMVAAESGQTPTRGSTDQIPMDVAEDYQRFFEDYDDSTLELEK